MYSVLVYLAVLRSDDSFLPATVLRLIQTLKYHTMLYYGQQVLVLFLLNHGSGVM